MGVNRAGVVTSSIILFAACGGKLLEHGGDTTGGAGSNGATGGSTTTGIIEPGQTDPGGPVGAGGMSVGVAGASVGATPCGNNVCGEGLVCCNPSCGTCVPPNQGCDAVACGDPIDPGKGGEGGSTVPLPPDIASLKSDFGFIWKDSWFITGCAQQAGHDCINIQACPNQTAPDFEDRGAVVNETFPLGGSMGTTYAVTFKFNGLAEGKYYQGGSWARPDTDAATPGAPGPQVNEGGVANDTFYIGGNALPSNYNSMRMRVLDPTKKEIARYYMNAYPQNSGAESHRLFLLSYVHTIDVPGRGFIEYHIGDSNCHAIDNCGPGNVVDGLCNGARSIPNEPPNIILPAMYTDVASPIQPRLVPLAVLNPVTGAKQPWHAQISHVTITKIVAK